MHLRQFYYYDQSEYEAICLLIEERLLSTKSHNATTACNLKPELNIEVFDKIQDYN